MPCWVRWTSYSGKTSSAAGDSRSRFSARGEQTSSGEPPPPCIPSRQRGATPRRTRWRGIMRRGKPSISTTPSVRSCATSQRGCMSPNGRAREHRSASPTFPLAPSLLLHLRVHLGLRDRDYPAREVRELLERFWPRLRFLIVVLRRHGPRIPHRARLSEGAVRTRTP